MHSPTDYVAVIVHFRDQSAVERLLADMATWTVRPSECVVVDNSSDLELGGGWAGDNEPFPVFVDDPVGNLGYAGAVNRGLGRARALGVERVVLLTQDAILEGAAVSHLLETMHSHERVAVCAPVLGFQTQPAVTFSGGGTLGRTCEPNHRDVWRPLEDVRDRGVRDVEWADGACLLLDIAAVAGVGNFDEAYFLYVEEVDLMYRLRQAGYRVLVDTRAVAFQEPGSFTPYLRTRNLIYFQRKNRGQFHWSASPRFVAGSLKQSLLLRTGSRFTTTAWAVRGIVDGLRARMGPPPQRWFR